MPANVLFTNPVVAQQSMAQDQFALAQRAQDLADRNTLLDNIRMSQDSARQSGDRRYQTDAYRSTAEGQNQIGMANAETARSQGGRRLDLDTVIAENEKGYRADQLATQKAIAEINANASRLRPQDVANIGRTVELHNSEADDFNNTAPNATLIIKNLADEMKKADEESNLKKAGNLANPYSWFGASDAQKAATDKSKAVPYGSYVAKALAANPTLAPYVELSGDKLNARMKKRVTIDNSGRLVEIDPMATGGRAPSPSPNPANPASFIKDLNSAPINQGDFNVSPYGQGSDMGAPTNAPAVEAPWQSLIREALSSGQGQPSQYGGTNQMAPVPVTVNPASFIQDATNLYPRILGGGMTNAPVPMKGRDGRTFSVNRLQ